jgi:hypothetical protein
MINPDVYKVHEKAESDKFFGSVEVSYQNGKAVIIRRTETIKPASCRDTRNLAPYEVPSAVNQS